MSKKKSHWSGATNTNPKAIILDYKKFDGELAIEVKNASIRQAKVSGVFQIANTENPFTLVKGELKVEVVCFWDGKKPKTTWTHLSIKNKYKLLTCHEGQVVSNIGRK